MTNYGKFRIFKLLMCSRLTTRSSSIAEANESTDDGREAGEEGVWERECTELAGPSVGATKRTITKTCGLNQSSGRSFPTVRATVSRLSQT
jgi:hypothetical protein